MKSICIIGCGRLGQDLIHHCDDDAYKITAIDMRPRPQSIPALIDYHQADITEDGAWQQAVRDANYVVNTTGLYQLPQHPARWENYFNANTLSAIKIQKAVSETCEKLIHISTCAVYEGVKFDPNVFEINEKTQVAPHSIYAKTKYYAEEVFAGSGKPHPVYILRPTAFDPVPASEHGLGLLYDRMDVSDLSSLILKIIASNHTAGGTYIASAAVAFDGEDLKRYDRRLNEIMARFYPEIAQLQHDLAFEVRAPLNVFSINRARQDFDWQPAHNFASFFAEARRDNALAQLKGHTQRRATLNQRIKGRLGKLLYALRREITT